MQLVILVSQVAHDAVQARQVEPDVAVAVEPGGQAE